MCNKNNKDRIHRVNHNRDKTGEEPPAIYQNMQKIFTNRAPWLWFFIIAGYVGLLVPFFLINKPLPVTNDQSAIVDTSSLYY